LRGLSATVELLVCTACYLVFANNMEWKWKDFQSEQQQRLLGIWQPMA